MLAGAAILLALQAIIHISVALGSVAAIKMALPLPSTNGCTVVATMATIGIVLSLANAPRAKASAQSGVEAVSAD